MYSNAKSTLSAQNASVRGIRKHLGQLAMQKHCVVQCKVDMECSDCERQTNSQTPRPPFPNNPHSDYWISVYATWFCKHGLYQRRGQGAYCRPGGCSQNMFIDVDGILHVHNASKCSSWCYNIAILDDHDTIVCSVCLNIGICYIVLQTCTISKKEAAPEDVHKTCS